MRNAVKDLIESLAIVWTNNIGRSGSGAAAAVTSGMVVRLAGTFGIAAVDIPTTSGLNTGVIITGGCFKVPKNTGVAYATGQLLGYDFTNNYVTTDTSNGILGQVTTSAAETDTTVEINLNPRPRVFRKVVTPTAGEDTANAIAIDVGFPVAGCIMHIMIKNSSNVFRVPQGAVTLSGNTVTINDSGLAATDAIHIRVEEVVGVSPLS